MEICCYQITTLCGESALCLLFANYTVGESRGIRRRGGTFFYTYVVTHKAMGVFGIVLEKKKYIFF